MTSNSRHGLPPRLMAHQSTRFANAQESKPSPSPGIRMTRFSGESGAEAGYGDGSAGRSSGRADGDVVRDAALAGSRVLRSAARGAGRSRVRGRSLPSVLRPDHGRTLGAARPLLPHAHGRVLRGDRQRARDRVALLGLILVTRVPPPESNRPGSGPVLAVEDAEPSAA